MKQGFRKLQSQVFSEVIVFILKRYIFQDRFILIFSLKAINYQILYMLLTFIFLLQTLIFYLNMKSSLIEQCNYLTHQSNNFFLVEVCAQFSMSYEDLCSVDSVLKFVYNILIFFLKYRHYCNESSRNYTLQSIIKLEISVAILFFAIQLQKNYNSLIIENMSSLAAARADNFYVSKNFNPSTIPPKKSDIEHQKPFKVVQGQRVGGGKVRYETPFHVRCQGCQNMVAKGVRFNAVKTWVDNFHSTKIYEFRMKCPQCVQKFVVRTDPQNCEYIYVSGARRIFQAKDCTDQNRIRDQSIQQKIRQDPFFKLQNQAKDKQVYGSMQQTLEKIHQINIRGQQDFQLNRLLRKKVRTLKQDEQSYLAQKRQKNIFIPLLDSHNKDEQMAEQVKFKNDKTKKIKKEEQQMSERNKLKQKMKKLNPNFQKLLKSQIKASNKPITNSYYKK